MYPVVTNREASKSERYLKLAEKYYGERFDWPDSEDEWERYYALMDFAKFLGFECFKPVIDESDLQNYIRKTPHLSMKWFLLHCNMCAQFIQYFWQ